MTKARVRAEETLAAIWCGEDAPHRPDETPFTAIAESVFRQYTRLWKTGTLSVNWSHLRRQLLPHFAGRPIADIDGKEVRNWFASLGATPAAADRSVPVLSVIMRKAEAMGLRPEGSNPCRSIRRYRRRDRERLLSDDEIRRLSERLSAHAEWQRQVAAARLLLLTGHPIRHRRMCAPLVKAHHHVHLELCREVAADHRPEPSLRAASPHSQVRHISHPMRSTT